MDVINNYFFARWTPFLSKICLKLLEITSYSTKNLKLDEKRAESKYSDMVYVTKFYVCLRKTIFSLRKFFKVIGNDFHSLDIHETLWNERNRDTCGAYMS